MSQSEPSIEQQANNFTVAIVGMYHYGSALVTASDCYRYGRRVVCDNLIFLTDDFV